MQGRAGGEDIVDDDVTYVRIDGHPVGEDESPRDILPALLSAETRLREGLMLFAEEELRAATGDVRGEERRDAFGLVIAAVEPAGVVQWDRYQYGPGEVAPEDIVRERRMGKVVGQERATFVFDAMDDPTGWAAGPERTDRPGEGRLEVEAVRAGTVAFEDAFERMAAGQATRVMDAGELIGPGGGEV